MTRDDKLEKMVKIVVEEVNIRDRKVIEELKRLRTSYESWQDKYSVTRSVRHYSLFQKDFREYCQLIDSGVVPRKIIEQLNAGNYDLSEQQQHQMPFSSSKIKAHGTPHRTVADKAHRQKEILVFLEGQTNFLSLEDIRKGIPVSQQHLRELLAELVDKGLLERRKIKYRYHWRKKEQKT